MIVEDNFKIKLGGSYFTDVQYLITYKDDPLFTVKRGEDGQLGISFSIYDKDQRKVAIIRSNVVVDFDKSDYLINHEMNKVYVFNKADNEIICEIKRKDDAPDSELEVSLKTYLPNGELLDASPDEIKVGTNRIKTCSMSYSRAGIALN